MHPEQDMLYMELRSDGKGRLMESGNCESETDPKPSGAAMSIQSPEHTDCEKHLRVLSDGKSLVAARAGVDAPIAGGLP